MAARTQSVRKTSTAKKPQIYTLEIHIIGGPVTDAFVDRNPVVARTLEIRGNQTLQHLHAAMFDAFDREDEHLYEFQFGKEPNDPKANRYVLADPFDDSAEDDPYIVGTVQATTDRLARLEGRSDLRILVRLWGRLVAPDQGYGHR